jgi:curli biogenesis system outer membrane secretion channel CsgG
MTSLPSLAFGLSIAILMSACATAAPPPAPPEPFATLAPIPPDPLIAQGPKKRVAVIKFENVSRFAEQYGVWDVGGGLAAQLTTALVESGAFIVVERTALADVLREQEMALEKLVTKDTASRVGQLLGAQLLVKGAVTEFEQAAGGGGVRLGIGLPVPGLGLGGGASTVRAHVAIDLRLIDTSSGQVVRSVRAEGKASKSGVAVNIDYQNVTLGGDAFNATPLGMATRDCIQTAVASIRRHTAHVPWTGRVMDVTDGKIYINAGQDANVKVGDVFAITHVVRELIDPETGAVRGVVENRLGQARIAAVDENFSVAEMLDQAAAPARGDLVKQMRTLPGVPAQ